MKTSCLASGMDPITPLDYPPEHAMAAFRTGSNTPVHAPAEIDLPRKAT